MGKVFKFTFVQHVSAVSYRIVTVLFAVLLLAAGIFGFMIADSLIESETDSDIERVYVVDTGISSGVDYNVLHESENEHYTGVEFVKAQSSSIEDAVKEASDFSSRACVLEVKNDDKGNFKLRVIKPEGFDAEKKSAKNLSHFIENNFRYVLYECGGLTDEQKNEMMTRSEYEVTVAGENGMGLDEEMIGNVLPVMFSIFLYMMLLLYGQTTARSVVSEKDSKMMESLLVMIRPYDLIFGKIFAIYTAALIQVCVWAAALVTGVSVGMASSETAGKKVSEFISVFAEKGGFTMQAVVISVIALLAGFLLYISLAAFAGSFASKTDEINNYFGIYTMVVVVCWIFPYMNLLNGNDHMMGILRYVPFTAPFTVPADVVIGNFTTVNALVSTAVVLIATVAVVFLAGRVYKALVLYRGEPVKIKDIMKIIKNS